MSMLFLSIGNPKIPKRLETHIDGIELRLDLFPQLDFEQIQTLTKSSSLPILLTLRKKSHGGKFEGPESLREKWIEKLLMLSPPFFDLEYDMRAPFLKEVIKKHPQTQFILSYHNFQNTPDNLDEIFAEMQKICAAGYKIATRTVSSSDTFRLLLFGKNKPQLSVISMGETGQFGRVLGPVTNNWIDYAALDAKTAPGQLSATDFSEIYRYPELNGQTEIYGLIGDPIQQSLGHIYHNAFFRKNRMNAVYIKMCVKPDELASFISLAKKMPIKGLSVTMPLKEKILPFVDAIDSQSSDIGALNTLLFRDGKIFARNTDGIGALDAIEAKELVANKRIVILGAGGSARAIAFEAKRRGGHVLILNRTVSKAKAMGYQSGSLEEVPEDYDILIQSTSHPMPIDASKILPSALVLDTVYVPKETLFLKQAARMGCRVIYGEEMFYNQAKAQQAFWFGS